MSDSDQNTTSDSIMPVNPTATPTPVIRPQVFSAKLEEKTIFNPKFIQFNFELLEPHELIFRAGQYISLKVAENGTRRSYSICSSPTITHGFELLVDIEPGGIGSQYLGNMQVGAEISLLAPMGVFTVTPANQESVIVMIGTGSGIAPFKAMVYELLQNEHDQRTVYLYWGMRYAEQLFWLDEFSELEDAFENFHFYPVISKPTPQWTLSRGHVTDVLQLQEPKPEKTGYYLCGNPAMVDEMKQILNRRKIPLQYIHHEKFL